MHWPTRTIAAPRRDTLTLALLLGLAAILPLWPSPAAAFNACAPRFVNRNINDAVLAAKAAKYCENMPYTEIEAMALVDHMRCSPEASAKIDRLLFTDQVHYKEILTQDPAHAACKQAAEIKVQALLAE